MAIDPTTGREEADLSFLDPGYIDMGVPENEGPAETAAEPGEEDPTSTAMSVPAPGEDPNEIQMTGQEGQVANPFPDDSHMQAALSEVPAPGESVSASAGRTQSFNGYTEAGKKYSNDVFGRADKNADSREARVRSEMDADLARIGATRSASIAAIDKRNEVETEHFNNRLDLHKGQLEFFEKQAELETMAFVHAKAEAQQYIAKYQQDMAGVRQLMNSTGNPLTGLDTGRKIGLGAAAFAQGMLAVKGININVTGQIDKWVDREMQAHQQMIQNKTAAANSQLTLYGLARQGAKDDWEGRQRLRGFVIDGLKTQIVMEADKYRSASASADAMAKAAQLDILQAQNTMAMHEKIRKESLDIKTQEINEAVARAHAAKEQQALGETASYHNKLIDLEREKLNKQYPSGEDFPTPIADPTSHPMDKNGQPLLDPKTGKPVDLVENKWVPDMSPGIDAGARTSALKKLSEYNGNYDAAKHALNRLRDLKAQAEKDGILGLNMLDKAASEKFARYKNQINTLVAQAVKADSGLVANEGEFQRHMALLDTRQFYQAGDNAAMIEDFENNLRDAHQARVNALEGTGIRRMTAKELEHSGQWKATTKVDEAGQAASDLRLSPDANVQSLSPYDQAAFRAMGSGRKNNDVVSRLPNADLQIGGGVSLRDNIDPVETLDKPTRGWSALVGKDVPQPAIAKEIDSLYKGIINPAKYREDNPVKPDAPGLPQRDELLRSNLINTLKKIGRDAQLPEVRDYANRLVGIRLAPDLTPQQTKYVEDMFAEE